MIINRSVLTALCVSAVLTSSGCWAGKSSDAKGSEKSGMILRPACNQHCDDIESMVVVYTKKAKKESDGGVKFFIEALKNTVDEKGFGEKIKVSGIENPIPKKWYAWMNSYIWIEFSAKSEGMKIGTIEYAIRMTTPSGSYYDSFLCAVTGSANTSSSCVRGGINRFVEKMIGEFVFEDSILNDKPAVD